jgi:hypothetical protein
VFDELLEKFLGKNGNGKFSGKFFNEKLVIRKENWGIDIGKVKIQWLKVKPSGGLLMEKSVIDESLIKNDILSQYEDGIQVTLDNGVVLNITKNSIYVPNFRHESFNAAEAKQVVAVIKKIWGRDEVDNNTKLCQAYENLYEPLNKALNEKVIINHI